MPHLIAEYSEELVFNNKELAVTLHQTLSQQETIKESSIKTRLVPVQGSVVGMQCTGNLFIHICLKLLPGRSDELRRKMALAIHPKIYTI
jgi:5-carboxymethyl-2-hydroxymuconate isomerase